MTDTHASTYQVFLQKGSLLHDLYPSNPQMEMWNDEEIKDTSNCIRNWSNPNINIKGTSRNISLTKTSNYSPWQVCVGNDLVLTTELELGKNLTYQWQKNEINIPNAVDRSWTISAATVDHSGTYTLHIFDACGDEIVSQPCIIKVSSDGYFAHTKASAYPMESTIRKKITFTYTGTTTNVFLKWTFDDNLTSTQKTVERLYDLKGKYTATLHVSLLDNPFCFRQFKVGPVVVMSNIMEDSYIGEKSKWAIRNLELYPVPMRDYLVITSKVSINHIWLRDIQGRLMDEQSKAGNTIILQTAHLSPGLYLLTVEDKNGMQCVKIVKQ